MSSGGGAGEVITGTTIAVCMEMAADAPMPRYGLALAAAKALHQLYEFVPARDESAYN